MICIRNTLRELKERILLFLDWKLKCYLRCMDVCGDKYFSVMCRDVDLTDWNNVVKCNNEMVKFCKDICSKTCNYHD